MWNITNSHDLHVVMSATDYVVCLNGHICCSGTPKTVANNHNYVVFGDRASNTLSICCTNTTISLSRWNNKNEKINAR